jgi:hypothetical protein
MKNRVLMKRFNVLGFPSIYLLRDGSTWQYTGSRTVQDVSAMGVGSMTNFQFRGSCEACD